MKPYLPLFEDQSEEKQFKKWKDKFRKKNIDVIIKNEKGKEYIQSVYELTFIIKDIQYSIVPWKDNWNCYKDMNQMTEKGFNSKEQCFRYLYNVIKDMGITI